MNKRDILFAKAVSGGGSSGSSLPEVTTDDNGKVLTVVEGAWDKASPDIPENNVVIFNGTTTSLNFPFNATLSNSKTYDDVISAITSGKFVVINVLLTKSSLYDRITLTFVKKAHNGTIYTFVSPFLDINSDPQIVYTGVRSDTPTETRFVISAINLVKAT